MFFKFFFLLSVGTNQSEASCALVLEACVSMEWPEHQEPGEKEPHGHNAGMSTAYTRAFICSLSCTAASLAVVRWRQCRLAFQSFLCCLATVQAVQ